VSTSSAGQRLTRARSGVGVAGPGSLEPRKRRRPGASPVTLMLFAAPSLFLLLLINLYPVIYAGWQSLRDGVRTVLENPLGFDYNRHPYGNDVGYLSELAAAGGGTERLGDTLVTLTDSESSMTRLATGSHLWQMRWQYTFNQARVWRTWEEQGLPGAAELRAMGVRRLALCTIMLQRNAHDLAPRRVARAVGAYLDFLRFDFQKTRMTLDDFRQRLSRNGIPA